MSVKVLSKDTVLKGYGTRVDYSKTEIASLKKSVEVAFVGGTDTAGGVLAVANPVGATVTITEVILVVTTKATAACTVDIGPAANATTLNDTLIDGLDVNAAAGNFDNISDAGGSGGRDVSWAASEYVTISTASGASAGLVGKLIINFIV